MKNLKLVTAIVCLVFATSLIAQNDDVPNLNVKTLSGESELLSDYIKDGQITLVTFWATWCAPCKRELSNFHDLYPDWKDDFGLEIIAITIDDSRNIHKVPSYVAAKEWEYTVISANDQEVFSAFNIQSIPQMYLIDQQGKIVWSHQGYKDGDEFELEDLLSDLAH